ncbi:MAG: sensor histidine kinase [Halobacteriaceae archaeon]
MESVESVPDGYADRLEALHVATRNLIDARREAAIADLAVEAAADVLQFPFSIFWAADRSEGTLAPTSVSDTVAEYREEGGEMVHDEADYLWDYFEREDPSLVEVTPGKAAAPVPPHSSIVVPVGEYGLLTVGAEERTDIEDAEVRLAAVLGKNVQAALSRAERERRLAEQRDGLKLLNSIVRHDIRNDLQVVRAAADQLAEDDMSDGNALTLIRERTESAVELTRTARELAETMLQTESEREAVALGPTLRAAATEVESAYGDDVVDVEGSVPEVDVLADDMLSSVFRNVIENGVEHDDGDPYVTVSAEEREGDVVVSIADDGPGIPDGVADEVFDRAAKGLDSDGTGIGLYLVATLVDRYGGSVSIAETGPEGTTVEITLPTA